MGWVNKRLYVIHGLNPEPWTSPDGSIARKNGKLYVQMHKSQTLDAFQNALIEEMRRFPKLDLMEGDVELALFLWRDLPVYTAESGRQVRRHRADATNLQKAIEDALQGLVYKNDSQVVHAETWIMEQHGDVEPVIIIEVATVAHRPLVDMSDYMQYEIFVSQPRTPEHTSESLEPVENIF